MKYLGVIEKGLARYFRHLVKNFATLTAPISALLREEKSFEWTCKCENVQLTSYPIFNIFDLELSTELHTEASSLELDVVVSCRIEES